MDQMVDSGQWAAHLNGVPVPAPACPADRVAIIWRRPAGLGGPGAHNSYTNTLSCCAHSPGEGGRPSVGDGAELGGGRLRNCACCGGESHRWGSEPKRGTAGQQGAAEEKDGGRGGGGALRESALRGGL